MNKVKIALQYEDNDRKKSLYSMEITIEKLLED